MGREAFIPAHQVTAVRLTSRHHRSLVWSQVWWHWLTTGRQKDGETDRAHAYMLYANDKGWWALGLFFSTFHSKLEHTENIIHKYSYPEATAVKEDVNKKLTWPQHILMSHCSTVYCIRLSVERPTLWFPVLVAVGIGSHTGGAVLRFINHAVTETLRPPPACLPPRQTDTHETQPMTSLAAHS